MDPQLKLSFLGGGFFFLWCFRKIIKKVCSIFYSSMWIIEFRYPRQRFKLTLHRGVCIFHFSRIGSDITERVSFGAVVERVILLQEAKRIGMVGATNESARGKTSGHLYCVELPLSPPQTECRTNGACAVQLIAR